MVDTPSSKIFRLANRNVQFTCFDGWTDPRLVRIHDFNLAGKSYNYRDNCWEKGNSVYFADYRNGEYFIALPPKTPAQSIMVMTCNIALSNQPVYEVTGDLMDELGGDGEPLILNPRIIKKLRFYHGKIFG